MIETLLISMLIITISIVLLCVSIVAKKNGRFTDICGQSSSYEKKESNCGQITSEWT